MSTFRRRLMVQAAREMGIPLHRWTAESGIVSNTWRDEVRNSPYSHPIDWKSVGATIGNGFLLVDGNRFLFSDEFSSEKEKFGKFWRVDIEIESLPTVNDEDFYLIDMGSVENTEVSAADSLSFRKDEFFSNTKLYSNASIYELFPKKVRADNFSNVSMVSFGVADAKNGNGIHFISVNRGGKGLQQ